MNNRKVKEIVKFSLNKNIQNKWFIILNVFMLITILITTNLSNIKNILESNNINLFNDNICIEIIDKENIALEEFQNEFSEDEKIEVKEVSENNYTKDTINDTVVVIEIAKDEKDVIKSKITSKEGIDGNVYDRILNVLTLVRNKEFSNKYDINKEAVQTLSKDLEIDRIMLGVNADNYNKKEIIKTVSTILIYLVSIFVFSKIANEIAQEKVSKSIEYVLTSVTEKEYLLAKIISVILLVVLQAIYMLIYYIIGNSIDTLINIGTISESTNSINILSIVQNIDTEIVLYILTVFVYGILTLILMSIIQAAISSKTINMSEAGNTIALLTTITIFCYFVTLILITPYTNMTMGIYILSCIPLLSNYFIPAIMIIGQATMPQIIISLILLVLSIPVAFKICAPIFKNGVLDYKPNKKSKMIKKVLTKEEEQELKFKKAKYKKFSFVVGMSLIVYVSVNIITELIGMSLILPMLKNKFDETQLTLILLLVTSIVSLVLAIVFVNLYKLPTDKIEKKKISLKNKISILFIGIFLMALLQTVLPFLYEAIGIDYTTEEMLSFISSMESPITKILMFITIAGEAAIFEELFFRKTLIDFSKKFGKLFSIVFPALLFGLVHMNSLQFFFAFGIGLIFGAIYVYTGDIKITMLLHFLNNGFSVAVLCFENNDDILYKIVLLAIITVAIGIILTLKNIVKTVKKNKIHLPKINKNEILDCKYIFLDYTFIISIALIALEFAVNENIL